jgi:hypothetical protein
MANLSRRDILRQLACGGLMIALPASALARPAGTLSPPLAARLGRLFSNRESARVIGRRYLALRPEEANLNRLTALICRTPENRARLAHASSEQLRGFLSEQQRIDFEHGRTVNIEGWVLSETETRLCAIAAIA